MTNKKTRITARLCIFFILTLICGCIMSCRSYTFSYKEKETAGVLASYTPVYPETAFAVFSDPHIYDVSLGTEGPDFQKYLDNDRKMLVQSEEILLEAIDIVKNSNADFLIVPGDITKDGEASSHRLFRAHITELENSGIPVYVVPGNHDISNPHAVRFSKSGHERVETIAPDEFSTLYGEYGYNEALARDPSSLSYIAEPVEGLWILALDSAYYEDNYEEDYPQTGGRFLQEEIDWIELMLQKAVEKNKAVIAMMHHGILEHYDSQKKYFGEYVVENYKAVSEMLARYKVRLCFTGHYHAQDITMKRWNEKTFIYDVETGSLVTYPCPIRFVKFDGTGNAEISSQLITSIPSYTAKGEDFFEFAKSYVYAGIEKIAIQTMVDLNMKKKEAEKLSGQIADAFVAHYAGDEVFTGDTMISTEGLSFMGRLVVGNRKALVHGLWQDKAPADNHIRINLNTGVWKEKE